jgi:hypothetical protein
MSFQKSKSIFDYVTDNTRYENLPPTTPANSQTFLNFSPQTRFQTATQTVDISTALRGFTSPNSKCNFHPKAN